MPNIFQVTRLALMALILLSASILFNSCAKGKQSQKESLYGELQASQGKVYTALVYNYIGTSPLYTNCYSAVLTQGRDEYTPQNLSTTCPVEVQTFVYEALIPIEKDGQMFFLPIQIRSYEPIQADQYMAEYIGGTEYSKVTVEARLDVSPFASYRGHGDYVFLAPGYESPEEERSHQPNSGEGGNDRP